MPPEPAPWDRKESAFRERKHERPPPDAGGGGQFPGSRWRDTHRGTREFYSPSPRRPPPGHYKQVFADDTPSRSEDEGFRCYSGRYGSSSGRDGIGRGYLRRSPWNPADGPRPHHDSPTGCGVQRSVATDLPKTVVSPSATGSSSPFVSLRDRHVRSGGDGVDDAPGTGRREEREPDHSLGSIAWKPLKWPRSSSFPPPPLSSSVKAVSSEPDDRKSDAPPMSAGKASPVQSQADSLPAADDGNPRKKQRLGWGQGLAKYEKEKVEGPEVCSTPTGPPQDGSASRAFLSEPSSSNLTTGDDAGLDSSASPQSGCRCSSPALEDKSQAVVEVSIPKKDASVPLVLIPENILPDVSVDIENLDVNSLSCVGSYVVDLLSADDTSAGDLSSVRQLVLDKLLLLKGEISKLVEKTEAVIDLCEIELKNLNDQDDKTDKTTTLQQVDCVHTGMMDVSLASSASSPWAFQHGFSIENSNEICSHSGCGIEKGFLHAKDTQLILEVTSCPDAKLLLVNTGYSVDKREEDSLVRVLTPTVAQVVSGPCLEDLSLSTRIMESNRDSARKASEIFSKFSPCTISPLDVLENDKTSSMHIKGKLMVRKRALRFKERALTLKFKALHHLWREDLRLLDLLSAKKNASKLQKRCEVRSHLSQNGQPKPRSSSKSRFPGAASNKALLPTGEILDLTSHLISDSEIHIFRKNLKMPALVLDDSERKHSRFITKNGFVEDPIMVEKEKSLINPWTEEEQEIFMEKLKMFGKDFGKIASFLDHKTIADCVEFYYKNHKLESFEAVRKSLGSRKQSQALSFSSYMVTSGKKWKNEPNAASLDMLGAASAIVSHSLGSTGARQKFSGKSLVRSSTLLKMSRGNSERITVDSLAETTAADVLVGIGGAMSSEGVSSCVTSSIDPSEKVESLPVDCLPFVEVNHAICEEDAYSDEACGELELIDWSDDEKSVFIRAFRLYGKDFARIALCLGTRSREQCKAFFSKARRCLGLDMIYQGSSMNGETPLSDANGCRSDTDEACAAEMDSTICSTQSFSKMDTDWSGFRIKSNSQDATPVGKCFSSVVPMKLDEMFDAGDTKEGSETSGEKLHSVFTGKDSQFPKKSLNQFGSTSGDLAGANLNSPSETLVDRRASDDDMNARSIDFLSLTESGVLSVPMGGSNLNTKDAVEMGSGRFHLDFSDSETVPQLANESFLTHKEKKLLAESHIDANAIFDTVSDGGNTFHGKYGNYFLDTIFGHVPQLQQGTNLPPLPRKKSQAMSWKQKENSHSSSKPLVQDSSKSITFGGHEQVASLPANFMLEGGKKRHPMQSKDHQPYMLGNQYLSGPDQPGHVLRGYPLHLLNTKDVEFDMLYQKPVFVGNISKKNGSTYSSPFFSTDFHADKSNKVSLSDPEPTYVRNNGESAEVLLRSCSQDTCVETEQKSTRTGDVKLFGKILSHPSPMPKPDSAEVTPPSNKEKRILNFRFPNGNADGTSSDPSNAETSSHLGLAAESDRGYDWLDGNKMQSCFSSLGTSALCLSKCPSVVSGVAYHPKKVKPVNTGGILVHRGLFPAEGKGQLVFPDLQNRVRIDGMAGFQQPARIAVNMVGAMEALDCTVDPVAALRLHFAKQIAPHCSSEDSQREDLGSR